MSAAAASQESTTENVKINRYEGMFLVDSNAFASDPDGITGEILKVLEKAGATVVAHRPWQDGRLAYEIEGRRKGLHYIVCFTMPTSGMAVLTRQCRLSDVILRHLVIAHSEELFNAVVDAITGVAAEEPAAEESASEKPAAAQAAET